MNRYQDSFESYVSSVSNYPRIDCEREAELSATILHGRNAKKVDAAVNELVLANLRLVLHCLKDYHAFLSSSEVCISMMDLVSEGNIALMAAARGFDAEYCREEDSESGQARFGTYACRCIRSRMQRAIKLSRLVHIPERHFTYRKKLQMIESEKGVQLTDEQISAKIGIRKERLDMVRWSGNCKTTRLEDLKTGDDSSFGIEDLPDTRQAQPDQEAAKNDLMALVMDKMAKLKPRTRQMLEQMFFGGKKTTLQELSAEFGVSKERCRQITQSGLKQLRDMICTEFQKTSSTGSGKKWPPELSVRVGDFTETWDSNIAWLSEVA